MPIKANPFADKRKNQPGRPSHAKKKAQARVRAKARWAKEKTIPKALEEKAKLDREITSRKANIAQMKKRENDLLEAMEKAPTPAAQRQIILGMISESGLNPMKELLDMAKVKTGAKALPADKRRDLLLKLLEYQAPKPKSIDIQADVSSNLTIQVTDFSNVTQKQLKQADSADPETLEVDTSYDEFLSPEQIALREKEKAAQLAIDAAVDEELED